MSYRKLLSVKMSGFNREGFLPKQGLKRHWYLQIFSFLAPVRRLVKKAACFVPGDPFVGFVPATDMKDAPLEVSLSKREGWVLCCITGKSREEQSLMLKYGQMYNKPLKTQ